MQLRYILFSLLLVAACKKDSSTPEADLFYEVSIEGYDVTFSNKTTGAVSYRWDFGDSTSSTEENPVHTYPGKGKYVPTLYATTKDGRVTEGSTVINIAKTSPVKMDDNTLADWDEVTTYDVAGAADEPYFKRAKFDYDANYLYMYFEVISKKENGDIFDIYLDSDNSTTTGLLTGTFSEGGYDVLLEGQPLLNTLAALNFAGKTQDDFYFPETSIIEFYNVGTIVQDGTTMKFEMRVLRSKIKNLTASKGVRVGVQAAKSDWSAILGSIPKETTPSFLINFE